jgi:hypothetical protein
LHHRHKRSNRSACRIPNIACLAGGTGGATVTLLARLGVEQPLAIDIFVVHGLNKAFGLRRQSGSLAGMIPEQFSQCWEHGFLIQEPKSLAGKVNQIS